MTGRVLVTDGLVIDPARKLEAVRDILIEGGKITEVAVDLSKTKALPGTTTI